MMRVVRIVKLILHLHHVQAREAVDVIGKQQFLQQTNVYEMEQKERIVLLIVNVILRVGMQIVLGVAQGVLLGQLVVA